MIAYVAESAASAPPPRQGPPLIPPPRSSALAGGPARSLGQPAPKGAGAGEYGEAEDAIAAFGADAAAEQGDGPSLEELEIQMGAEVSARDAASTRRADRPRATLGEEDDDSGVGKSAPLPEVEDLVGRLPAEVRDAVEELLRVRFVSVKRLPKQVLANEAEKGGAAD